MRWVFKCTALKVLLNHSILEHAGCCNMTPDNGSRNEAFLCFASGDSRMLSQSSRVGMGSHAQWHLCQLKGREPVISSLDNNWVENQIRPIAIGRHNWLFAGSLRAGQRAAAIMSLIHSARLNGHDVYAYLKDVLERLPSQPASRVGELFPHRWSSAQ